MELTHQDVLDILTVLEGSDVAYLEVVVGGTKLVASFDEGADPGHPGGGGQPTATLGESAAKPSADAAIMPPAPSDPSVPAAARSPSEPELSVADDLVPVTAPVVGVFYRAPEPGASPYTEVGTRVEEGATVGLVEVMKMFNSVTARVSGEVVDILVDNEDFVEFGQTLLTIRPDAST